MVNTKTMGHVFKHPNFYKKLKASQVKKDISPDDAAEPAEGRTPQASSSKPQAASSKPQAPSLDKNEAQASSPKQQGSSFKP
jgi:hypothetical protein